MEDWGLFLSCVYPIKELEKVFKIGQCVRYSRGLSESLRRALLVYQQRKKFSSKLKRACAGNVSKLIDPYLN